MDPEPEPRPLYRPRSFGGGGILDDINRSIGQPYQPTPVETEYDRMMKEFRQQWDRTAEQKRQEFQNDNIERAIRCNRFGSREVYADCHNW